MILTSIVVAILGRLLSLGLYPLTDPTEGRYADIGRRIVETGDWVTPWIDAGVPFWGKPPLSFWMTGSSLQLLGDSAFAARLPHLVAGALILWILFDLFKRQGMNKVGLYAAAITAGSVIFYIASGTVMTDAALALGCTIAMRGFWLSVNGPASQRNRECYVFFVGLAVGLLAKGPLALVLCLTPAGLWTLYTRNLTQVLSQLPWVRGTLLMLLIAVPWYVIAELRTPGFLEYFIVGEHWQRYLQKDWAGDLYGKGHGKPHGIIWLYALAGMMPWTLLLPLLAWLTRGTRSQTPDHVPPYAMLYFGLWGLFPLAFFSLSSNVLIAYTLPAIAPLACLGALWLGRKTATTKIQNTLVAGLLITTSISLIAVAYLQLSGKNKTISTAVLIHTYQNAQQGEPLYFYQAVPQSAKFYSAGQARLLKSVEDLQQAVSAEHPLFIALDDAQIASMPIDVKAVLVEVAHEGRYTLFQIRRGGTAS